MSTFAADLSQLLRQKYISSTQLKHVLACLNADTEKILQEHIAACTHLPAQAFAVECCLARFDTMAPYRPLLYQLYTRLWDQPLSALPSGGLLFIHALYTSFTHLWKKHHTAMNIPMLYSAVTTYAYFISIPAWHDSDDARVLATLEKTTQCISWIERLDITHDMVAFFASI